MTTVAQELDSVKDLVSHILLTKPETRNSDTLLYIEACEYLGAKNFEDMEKLNLSIITVHKVRQVIQNKDGLFLPDVNVVESRKNRRYKIRDYMSRLKKENK